MENHRPLILVSNDDGIRAKGLAELVKALRPLGEIVIMAPETARSGSSCALSVHHAVHYQMLRKSVGLTAYSCSGRPIDCVKLAFHTVLERKPDLVVAGINHGDNSSVNVHYSGTMGVVKEGCLKGVPSVAFSLCSYAPDADFTPIVPYIHDIAAKVLEKGLPRLTCLNVNFPAEKELKGIKVCRQAEGDWVNEWEHVTLHNDRDFYWLSGEFLCTNPDDTTTDRWALANGYAAITPVKVDVTDYGLMDELAGWFV